MKHLERLLLIAIALVVGGGLGYKLLPSFEPIYFVFFMIAVLSLGEFFYRIDKWICEHPKN